MFHSHIVPVEEMARYKCRVVCTGPNFTLVQIGTVSRPPALPLLRLYSLGIESWPFISLSPLPPSLSLSSLFPSLNLLSPPPSHISLSLLAGGAAMESRCGACGLPGMGREGSRPPGAQGLWVAAAASRPASAWGLWAAVVTGPGGFIVILSVLVRI
jgi:hypothetical protein